MFLPAVTASCSGPLAGKFMVDQPQAAPPCRQKPHSSQLGFFVVVTVGFAFGGRALAFNSRVGFAFFMVWMVLAKVGFLALRPRRQCRGSVCLALHTGLIFLMQLILFIFLFESFLTRKMGNPARFSPQLRVMSRAFTGCLPRN